MRVHWINETFIKLSQAAQRVAPLTDGLVQSLQRIVGNNNVSQAMAVREQHGKDESYHVYVDALLNHWSFELMLSMNKIFSLFESDIY